MAFSKLPSINLSDRKPVWIALSDLYLDNELQPYDFASISRTLRKSPYSMDEIRSIDKYEVFPVLQWNLMGVAGQWAGFQEEWLIEEITSFIRKNNRFSRLLVEISYYSFKWMHSEPWKEIEKYYKES